MIKMQGRPKSRQPRQFRRKHYIGLIWHTTVRFIMDFKVSLLEKPFKTI
jgi:hypothetical protein